MEILWNLHKNHWKLFFVGNLLGNPIMKIENKNPPKPPLPFSGRGFSIYNTNGLTNYTHHPKLQLQRFTYFHTVTMQTPYWWQSVTPHSPQITSSWTDPQTQLPASSLDPSNLPSQTASISNWSLCHNTLDWQTQTTRAHTHHNQKMVRGNVW